MLLVGGATRMPAIRRFVRNMTGLDPQEFAVDPDLVRQPCLLHLPLHLRLSGPPPTLDPPPLPPVPPHQKLYACPVLLAGASCARLIGLRGVLLQPAAMRAGGGAGGGSPGWHL